MQYSHEGVRFSSDDFNRQQVVFGFCCRHFFVPNGNGVHYD